LRARRIRVNVLFGSRWRLLRLVRCQGSPSNPLPVEIPVRLATAPVPKAGWKLNLRLHPNLTLGSDSVPRHIRVYLIRLLVHAVIMYHFTILRRKLRSSPFSDMLGRCHNKAIHRNKPHIGSCRALARPLPSGSPFKSRGPTAAPLALAGCVYDTLRKSTCSAANWKTKRPNRSSCCRVRSQPTSASGV
jgi:hypothetical protein